MKNLTEYWAPAIKVISSNPCAEPLLRIKILFSYYQYAQMSSHQPKIMTFLPTLPSGNGHWEHESNPIPEPLSHISGSSFLANLTPRNKQSFKAK